MFVAGSKKIEDRYLRLLSRHKDFLINTISQYYPFTEAMLDEYEDLLQWKDNEGIGNFGLSINKNLPWSESLLLKYKDKWDWSIISHFIIGDRLWNEDLLDKIGSYCNWNCLYNYNDCIPWNAELIHKYQGNLDLKWLSGNHTEDWKVSLIDELNGNISLDRNINNKNLEGSYEFLEKYPHLVNWEKTTKTYCTIETMSINLLEHFADKWNWSVLSKYKGEPWSIGFFMKYIDRWDFSELSWNIDFPFSETLIDKYIDKWDWRGLSYNKSLPWSDSLIRKYFKKWDFEMLSGNAGLPWTKEFIEKYIGLWNWTDLSDNRGLPWTYDLIDYFIDKWDWSNLPVNWNIHKNIDFYERYENRLFWNPFCYEDWTAELGRNGSQRIVHELLKRMKK